MFAITQPLTRLLEFGLDIFWMLNVTADIQNLPIVKFEFGSGTHCYTQLLTQNISDRKL